MNTETLYLAVDGGATHCRARIADADGVALGHGDAGAASTRLGMPALFAAILAATENAMRDAGLTAGRVGELHAGLGLAGLSLQADRSAVLSHPHPFASMTVESDAYAACLGAHRGKDGGIVIFGTGSSACAILDGRTVTVGGWGFQLGDQGGAARLGLTALRRALLAHENIVPATALSRALLDRFDGAPENAVLWAAEARPADFGSLAPIVCQHADAGDAMAVALLRGAGADAVQLIAALHERGAERIALVGGFAPHLRPWLPQEEPSYLVEPDGDALDGALALARAGKDRQAGDVR